MKIERERESYVSNITVEACERGATIHFKKSSCMYISVVKSKTRSFFSTYIDTFLNQMIEFRIYFIILYKYAIRATLLRYISIFLSFLKIVPNYN